MTIMEWLLTPIEIKPLWIITFLVVDVVVAAVREAKDEQNE